MSNQTVSICNGNECGCGCKCGSKKPLEEIQTLMQTHGLGGDVVSNVRLLLMSLEAHRTSNDGRALIEDVRIVNAKQN